jgi:hypothetical protein
LGCYNPILLGYWFLCLLLPLYSFLVLAAKKGEKIQISSHSVCGSFGSVFLFWLLFLFWPLYFSFDYCFCFGHCCGLYPLINVWNKTAGVLFNVIWWSSGHHPLSHQFVMIPLLWSTNDVCLDISHMHHNLCYDTLAPLGWFYLVWTWSLSLNVLLIWHIMSTHLIHIHAHI